MPTDRLRLSYPAEPSSVRHVRNELRRWLGVETDPDRVDDVTLVASELVTNAVEAGPDGSMVGVAARLVGTTMYLVVVNEQPDSPVIDLDALWERGGEEHRGVEMPAGPAIRGRGLPIVDALAEWWSVVSDGHIVARCRIDLSPPP